MHIGLVTPRYPPNTEGGGAVSARLLARMLSANTAVEKVTVYTFDGDGPSNQDGTRIRRYKSPSQFSFEIINTYAYIKLRSVLPQDDVDIIHSYNMQLHPVVGHLSEKFEIPSVATLNSYAYIPYSEIDIPVNSLLEWYKHLSKHTTSHVLRNRMRNIDSFIAISSTVADIYRNNLLDNHCIKIVPNMYEPELFDVNLSDVGSSTNTRANKHSVLYVGSLRETKGVKYLIMSARHLPDDFHVTIAGGGKNENKLRQLSEEYGVSNQVTLLGRVPHETVQSLYSWT